MNEELQTLLSSTRDVGDVVRVISELARPFGEIRHWKFSRDSAHGALGFFITLDDPSRHADFVDKWGGRLVGEEVFLEVPMPRTKGGG